MKGTSEILDNKPDGKFITGVVEGFYGIPWTSDQRKLLFTWMNSMGMTTYMYAPKDDAKHRAFWREQYSVEEAENLTGLIEAAAENNVQLVYALSPGLDISFSSSKDTQFLKKKLEQVAAFGCKAFALLFDDIDPELSFSDKSAFQSSACAQVSVTNDVYEHLGQPEFYFCPTEYCTSRAVPTLISSGYLNTIGSKLLNRINVLWTGSKVISKKLTIMELEEISSVLKRPPVIWDNIHANDYDPRRIFLGPYDGRSPEIIPYIRGVLTNPNCEFESNYIPLHTLAQWSKSNPTGVKKDIITDNRLSPVASDIKLESENEYLSDEDIPIGDNTTYKPRLALKRAIADWHLEFNKYRQPPKQVMVAAPVNIPGVPVPQPTTSDSSVPIYSDLENSDLQMSTPRLAPLENPSFLQPAGTVLVNSLVDPVSSPIHKDDSGSESDVSLDTEPMECVPSAITDSLNVLDNNTDLPKNQSFDSMMQVEIGQCSCSSECDETKSLNNFDCLMTVEDVDLLISLFYLPFEYGPKPLQALLDFHWLKMNSHAVRENNSQELTEWWERCDKFLSWVNRVQILNDKLKQVPNQAINYYFFPYLWDFIGVLQSCSAFVRWLGFGQVTKEAIPHLQGTDTWVNKDYRDLFLSGDQEPWCFNGGLQREFQRMLPLPSVDDLLFIRPPDRILNKTYNYRPYKPSDERSVYEVCLKTCDNGMDGSEVFPEYPEVVGDKYVGPLLTLSPDLCFVVEDVEGVMGYVVAAVDAKQLRQKINVAWLPSMCEKYPKPDGANELTPAEEVMSSFHSSQMELPVGILESPFPSVIKLNVIPSRVEDLALTKRLLASALCALKSKGSTGVHVEVNMGDKYILEQYRHLGFVPLKNVITEPDVLFLGRLL